MKAVRLLHSLTRTTASLLSASHHCHTVKTTLTIFTYPLCIGMDSMNTINRRIAPFHESADGAALSLQSGTSRTRQQRQVNLLAKRQLFTVLSVRSSRDYGSQLTTLPFEYSEVHLSIARNILRTMACSVTVKFTMINAVHQIHGPKGFPDWSYPNMRHGS